MNKVLVTNWNSRVKEDDTVYHIGDFCFRGGSEGGSNKAKYWNNQLNGTIVHVKGNHDKNNSVKSIVTHLVMEFGNKVVLATHVPPTMRLEVPEYFDFVICGHVHEKWKHVWLEEDYNNDPIPIINVGTDMWKFAPVRLDEVLVYYDKIVREKK
jgi:calcineurin-like phosphoesterase family protein